MPYAKVLQKNLENTPAPNRRRSENRHWDIRTETAWKQKMLSDVMIEISKGKIKTAWQG